MFTHDQIWAVIDRLAETRGLSASGLARQAGLDPTAFNRSKRISPNGKPRWPSTESLSKILAVTQCTMSDLLTLMNQAPEAQKSVPVFSYHHVESGHLNEKASARLSVAFDIGDDGFAVTLEDDQLHPLFRAGCVLVADPGAKVKGEDRVLVFSKKDGLKGGIVQSTQKKNLVILLPGTHFSEMSLADSDIEWTARILWASQ